MIKHTEQTAAAEIGNRIRTAREIRGLTLKEATRLIWGENLASSRLSNYEQGLREPDVSTVLQIARVLEKSPTEIMFGTLHTTLHGKDLPLPVEDSALPTYVTKAIHAVRSAYTAGAEQSFFTSLSSFLLSIRFPNSSSNGNNKRTGEVTKSEQDIASHAKATVAKKVRGKMHHEGAQRKSKSS